MGAFDEPMEDEGEEPMEEHMNRTEPMVRFVVLLCLFIYMKKIVIIE